MKSGKKSEAEVQQLNSWLYLLISAFSKGNLVGTVLRFHCMLGGIDPTFSLISREKVYLPRMRIELTNRLVYWHIFRSQMPSNARPSKMFYTLIFIHFLTLPPNILLYAYDFGIFVVYLISSSIHIN